MGKARGLGDGPHFRTVNRSDNGRGNAYCRCNHTLLVVKRHEGPGQSGRERVSVDHRTVRVEPSCHGSVRRGDDPREGVEGRELCRRKQRDREEGMLPGGKLASLNAFPRALEELRMYVAISERGKARVCAEPIPMGKRAWSLTTEHAGERVSEASLMPTHLGPLPTSHGGAELGLLLVIQRGGGTKKPADGLPPDTSAEVGAGVLVSDAQVHPPAHGLPCNILNHGRGVASQQDFVPAVVIPPVKGTKLPTKAGSGGEGGRGRASDAGPRGPCRTELGLGVGEKGDDLAVRKERIPNGLRPVEQWEDMGVKSGVSILRGT